MENKEIKLAAERVYPMDKSLQEAFIKGAEYQLKYITIDEFKQLCKDYNIKYSFNNNLK